MENNTEAPINATSSKKTINCDWCQAKIENPRPGQKHCAAKIRNCKKLHDQHIYRLGKNKDQKKSSRKTPALKDSVRLQRLLKVISRGGIFSPLQLQHLTGITNIPQAVRDLKDNQFDIRCKKNGAKTGCGRQIAFYSLHKHV
jgi:hypothetical protein